MQTSAIEIGTHKSVIKIGTHAIKIGTFLTCCYLYRYIFIPTFTKIGTCVIKIGTRLTWARVRIRFRVRVRVRIRFRVGLEQGLAEVRVSVGWLG